VKFFGSEVNECFHAWSAVKALMSLGFSAGRDWCEGLMVMTNENGKKESMNYIVRL
jgi:hypothetical protein